MIRDIIYKVMYLFIDFFSLIGSTYPRISYLFLIENKKLTFLNENKGWS